MYKYSKKALITDLLFLLVLLYLIVFVDVDIIYKVVLVAVAAMIVRDNLKEMQATFELAGDKMIVRRKDKVVREIKYKDMKYLTITRKNKKWVVIADDDKILFTIKPKIESYEKMVSDLIRLNQSNKKMEVHDYIKRTYKDQ
ncbi:MAG: hypothetical protein JXR88_16285 [Clostridia bacterium]|nr:hypothetical protein [Clostridia bacterium]